MDAERKLISLQVKYDTLEKTHFTVKQQMKKMKVGCFSVCVCGGEGGGGGGGVGGGGGGGGGWGGGVGTSSGSSIVTVSHCAVCTVVIHKAHLLPFACCT